MFESYNGQSQIQRAQSAQPNPKGKYTGERISGAKYRAIVDLAAQGRQIDRIAREAGVTWRTAKAVVERESRQIAVRKQELLDQSLRIARRAANQIEAKINDKARLAELVPVYGVAVDKVNLLSAADPLAGVQQHLHLHLQPNDVTGKFNALLDRLESKARALPAIPSVSKDGNLPEDAPRPALAEERTDTEQRESRSA
jgi:hypothetical protein